MSEAMAKVSAREHWTAFLYETRAGLLRKLTLNKQILPRELLACNLGSHTSSDTYRRDDHLQAAVVAHVHMFFM